MPKEEWKPLEEIEDPARRAVAQRFREVLYELKMNQTAFAEATDGVLQREEVNAAVNGKTLATTHRWAEALANAAQVTNDAAKEFIQGKVDLTEMYRRSVVARSGVTSLPSLRMDGVRALIAARGRERNVPPSAIEAAVSVRALAGVSSLTTDQIDHLLDLAQGFDRGVSLLFRHVVKDAETEDPRDDLTKPATKLPKRGGKKG